MDPCPASRGVCFSIAAYGDPLRHPDAIADLPAGVEDHGARRQAVARRRHPQPVAAVRQDRQVQPVRRGGRQRHPTPEDRTVDVAVAPAGDPVAEGDTPLRRLANDLNLYGHCPFPPVRADGDDPEARNPAARHGLVTKSFRDPDQGVRRGDREPDAAIDGTPGRLVDENLNVDPEEPCAVGQLTEIDRNGGPSRGVGLPQRRGLRRRRDHLSRKPEQVFPPSGIGHGSAVQRDARKAAEMRSRRAVEIAYGDGPVIDAPGSEGAGHPEVDGQARRHEGGDGKSGLRQGGSMPSRGETHTPDAILRGSREMHRNGDTVVVVQMGNGVQKDLSARTPNDEVEGKVQWPTRGASVECGDVDRLSRAVNPPVQPKIGADRSQGRAAGNSASREIQRGLVEIEQRESTVRAVEMQSRGTLAAASLQDGLGEVDEALGVAAGRFQDVVILGNQLHPHARPRQRVGEMADLYRQTVASPPDRGGKICAQDELHLIEAAVGIGCAIAGRNLDGVETRFGEGGGQRQDGVHQTVGHEMRHRGAAVPDPHAVLTIQGGRVGGILIP